jgi:hypothetical protein
MRWISIAVAIVAFSTSAECKTPKIDKQLAQLVTMTPADFAAKTAVTDDNLEVAAKFDTAGAFHYKPGFMSTADADVFLRAFVEKTTGRALFQVYYNASVVASAWPGLGQANFIGPRGLESIDVTKISSDVSCARYSCSYYEAVAADLPEETVRWMAAQYQAGANNGVEIRFKGKTLDLQIGIMPAEFAGLISRVDEYRKAHGLRSAQ